MENGNNPANKETEHALFNRYKEAVSGRLLPQDKDEAQYAAFLIGYRAGMDEAIKELKKKFPINMSNITTIAQIKNEKANGEVIMAIQVTLKGVYERRDVNPGTPKATTVQNLVLSDGTGEIRASLWGHPPADEHKGKQFVIHSNKNPRGSGFVGVTVKDGQDQNGNSRRELQISKSATIQFVEVYHGSPAAKAAASSGGSGGSANAASVPASTLGAATKAATNGPVTLEKLANFWEWCYVEAEKRQAKFGFTDQIKQACIGSLFIQGTRDGLYRDLCEPAPYAKVSTDGTVVGAIQADIVSDKGGNDGDVPF